MITDAHHQTRLLIGTLLLLIISTASAQRANPTPVAGAAAGSTPRPAPSFFGIPVSGEMKLEDALVANKWTVTILAPGKKPWGDMRFNSDGTFSSLNGFAGDWKKTGPRTISLGATGISLTFDERFEKFEGFDAAGVRHSTGAKKVAAPVVAANPATPAPTPLPLPGRATPAPPSPVAKLATPPMPSVPAPRKVPVGVPSDAQYFGGKWYRLYTDECSWPDAKQRCETRYGGRLAVVPDARTWEFIKTITADKWFWLGATDEVVVGNWKWIDGTAMSFTAWDRGQPDNVGAREHYLHGGFGDSGDWNDAPKDGRIGRRRVVGYVCEWRDR
jgi:hypothetical protein